MYPVPHWYRKPVSDLPVIARLSADRTKGSCRDDAFQSRIRLWPNKRRTGVEPATSSLAPSIRRHSWVVMSAALSWAARSQAIPEIQTNGCLLANERTANRRRSARRDGTGYAPAARRRPLARWALSPQAVKAIREQMLLRVHRRPSACARMRYGGVAGHGWRRRACPTDVRARRKQDFVRVGGPNSGFEVSAMTSVAAAFFASTFRICREQIPHLSPISRRVSVNIRFFGYQRILPLVLVRS